MSFGGPKSELGLALDAGAQGIADAHALLVGAAGPVAPAHPPAIAVAPPSVVAALPETKHAPSPKGADAPSILSEVLGKAADDVKALREKFGAASPASSAAAAARDPLMLDLEAKGGPDLPPGSPGSPPAFAPWLKNNELANDPTLDPFLSFKPGVVISGFAVPPGFFWEYEYWFGRGLQPQYEHWFGRGPQTEGDFFLNGHTAQEESVKSLSSQHPWIQAIAYLNALPAPVNWFQALKKNNDPVLGDKEQLLRDFWISNRHKSGPLSGLRHLIAALLGVSFNSLVPAVSVGTPPLWHSWYDREKEKLRCMVECTFPYITLVGGELESVDMFQLPPLAPMQVRFEFTIAVLPNHKLEMESPLLSFAMRNKNYDQFSDLSFYKNQFQLEQALQSSLTLIDLLFFDIDKRTAVEAQQNFYIIEHLGALFVFVVQYPVLEKLKDPYKKIRRLTKLSDPALVSLHYTSLRTTLTECKRTLYGLPPTENVFATDPSVENFLSFKPTVVVSNFDTFDPKYVFYDYGHWFGTNEPRVDDEVWARLFSWDILERGVGLHTFLNGKQVVLERGQAEVQAAAARDAQESDDEYDAMPAQPAVDPRPAIPAVFSDHSLWIAEIPKTRQGAALWHGDNPANWNPAYGKEALLRDFWIENINQSGPIKCLLRLVEYFLINKNADLQEVNFEPATHYWRTWYNFDAQELCCLVEVCFPDFAIPGIKTFGQLPGQNLGPRCPISARFEFTVAVKADRQLEMKSPLLSVWMPDDSLLRDKPYYQAHHSPEQALQSCLTLVDLLFFDIHQRSNVGEQKNFYIYEHIEALFAFEKQHPFVLILKDSLKQLKAGADPLYVNLIKNLVELRRMLPKGLAAGVDPSLVIVSPDGKAIPAVVKFQHDYCIPNDIRHYDASFWTQQSPPVAPPSDSDEEKKMDAGAGGQGTYAKYWERFISEQIERPYTLDLSSEQFIYETRDGRRQGIQEFLYNRLPKGLFYQDDLPVNKIWDRKRLIRSHPWRPDEIKGADDFILNLPSLERYALFNLGADGFLSAFLILIKGLKPDEEKNYESLANSPGFFKIFIKIEEHNETTLKCYVYGHCSKVRTHVLENHPSGIVEETKDESAPLHIELSWTAVLHGADSIVTSDYQILLGGEKDFSLQENSYFKYLYHSSENKLKPKTVALPSSPSVSSTDPPLLLPTSLLTLPMRGLDNAGCVNIAEFVYGHIRACIGQAYYQWQKDPLRQKESRALLYINPFFMRSTDPTVPARIGWQLLATLLNRDEALKPETVCAGLERYYTAQIQQLHLSQAAENDLLQAIAITMAETTVIFQESQWVIPADIIVFPDLPPEDYGLGREFYLYPYEEAAKAARASELARIGFVPPRHREVPSWEKTTHWSFEFTVTPDSSPGILQALKKRAIEPAKDTDGHFYSSLKLIEELLNDKPRSNGVFIDHVLLNDRSLYDSQLPLKAYAGGELYDFVAGLDRLEMSIDQIQRVADEQKTDPRPQVERFCREFTKEQLGAEEKEEDGIIGVTPPAIEDIFNKKVIIRSFEQSGVASLLVDILLSDYTLDSEVLAEAQSHFRLTMPPEIKKQYHLQIERRSEHELHCTVYSMVNVILHSDDSGHTEFDDVLGVQGLSVPKREKRAFWQVRSAINYKVSLKEGLLDIPKADIRLAVYRAVGHEEWLILPPDKVLTAAESKRIHAKYEAFTKWEKFEGGPVFDHIKNYIAPAGTFVLPPPNIAARVAIVTDKSKVADSESVQANFYELARFAGIATEGRPKLVIERTALGIEFNSYFGYLDQFEAFFIEYKKKNSDWRLRKTDKEKFVAFVLEAIVYLKKYYLSLQKYHQASTPIDHSALHNAQKALKAAETVFKIPGVDSTAPPTTFQKIAEFLDSKVFHDSLFHASTLPGAIPLKSLAVELGTAAASAKNIIWQAIAEFTVFYEKFGFNEAARDRELKEQYWVQHIPSSVILQALLELAWVMPSHASGQGETLLPLALSLKHENFFSFQELEGSRALKTKIALWETLAYVKRPHSVVETDPLYECAQLLLKQSKETSNAKSNLSFAKKFAAAYKKACVLICTDEFNSLVFPKKKLSGSSSKSNAAGAGAPPSSPAESESDEPGDGEIKDDALGVAEDPDLVIVDLPADLPAPPGVSQTSSNLDVADVPFLSADKLATLIKETVRKLLSTAASPQKIPPASTLERLVEVSFTEAEEKLFNLLLALGVVDSKWFKLPTVSIAPNLATFASPPSTPPATLSRPPSRPPSP